MYAPYCLAETGELGDRESCRQWWVLGSRSLAAERNKIPLWHDTCLRCRTTVTLPC